MTNTIPNVPRYRVEKTGRGFWPYCVRAGDGTREVFVGHQKQCAVVAAELETAFEDGKFVSCIAPSPAGVDGLEVVGTLRYFMDYPDSPHSAPGYITHQFNPASWDHAGEAAGEHKLCRLSDAQAIIDGLREDRDSHQRACIRAMEERDRKARRITELGLLLQTAEHVLSEANFVSTGEVVETTQADRDEVREKIIATLTTGSEVEA